MLFPFVLLVAGESAARWAGYGGYPPTILHVGSDGKRDWYSTSRFGTDTFFYRNLSLKGGMYGVPFTVPPPENTVRICFFGDSAMQGYPQSPVLANSAFLESMLNDAWGGRRKAQVLNFGCTAVASFASMHFLEEVLPHKPDLVVIMAGNNEYYGAYGVASLHAAGTSPWGMKLMRWSRQFAIAQFLDEKLQPAPKDKSVLQQTLMERVAAVGQIGPDDRLRAAAANVARTHLRRMVEMCAESRIPVIICTLPTNERGMAPIGEDVQPALDEARRKAFASKLEEGEKLLATNPASAEKALRDAIASWSKHARSHFLLAQSLTAQERHEEALNEYVAARDLDTMPWRATSDTNNAARMAPIGLERAWLCDMEEAFRLESPGGAIGWELMDDHVHMTLRGQAIFARTIARAMSKLSGGLFVDPDVLAALPDWEEYARRQGRNKFDEYAAATRMKTLFEIGFMKRANADALQRFDAACAGLLAGMTPREREAANLWRKDETLHISNQRPITAVVGYFRMVDRDFAGAAEMFAIARRSVNPVSLWRLQNNWYLLRCRRHLYDQPSSEDQALLAEAIEVGELLNRFTGFKDPMGPSFLGMAYNLAGNHKAAIYYLDEMVRFAKGWEGADVVAALADSLVKTGQMERAIKLLRLARRDVDMQPLADAMLARLGVPASGDEP